MIENTTLCYAELDGRWLMLHRTKKKEDINRDKWIGIGGHAEKGESPEDCIRREMREETGLSAGELKFRGIVTFVYGDVTEYMYLFTARELTDASGSAVTLDTQLPACAEGEPAWVRKEDVFSLPIWEGDRIFLRYLCEDRSFFSLKLVYDDDGKLVETATDGVTTSDLT